MGDFERVNFKVVDILSFSFLLLGKQFGRLPFCGKQSALELLRVVPSRKRKIQILNGVSGIVKPSR